MTEEQQALVTAARKRAQIRREIRSENDRIADQLDALCNEIERLSGIVPEVLEECNDALCSENQRLRDQVKTLQELYEAKVPLHERRKLPSPGTEGVLAEIEADPQLLFQQSFWPGCTCMECYAAHKAEEFYGDLMLAVRRLRQASACSGEGPDEALKWWGDKGKLQNKYPRADETEE